MRDCNPFVKRLHSIARIPGREDQKERFCGGLETSQRKACINPSHGGWRNMISFRFTFTALRALVNRNGRDNGE